jgi:hypothetical protein
MEFEWHDAVLHTVVLRARESPTESAAAERLLRDKEQTKLH